MSCFNALANCCPPPVPPETPCCVNPGDIETWFPNGLNLSIAGTTVYIPKLGWNIDGCCAYNTVTSSIPLVRNCTPDWSYKASETIKCESVVAKLKVAYGSLEVEDITCDLNQCPDIIVGARTATNITEQAARVVTSEIEIGTITVKVAKFLRTCSTPGTPECVYVLSVSVSLAVRGGGVREAYQKTVRQLEYLDPDVLSCCTVGTIPPPTVPEIKQQWYQEQTIGSIRSPLCDNLPQTQLPLIRQLDITRVKVLTTLTSPQVFSYLDNPFLDLCGLNYPCARPQNQNVDRVTVTFNRTLPPVYSQRLHQTIPGIEKCCVSRYITDFPTPPEAYDIYGPDKWIPTGSSIEQPPLPGTGNLRPSIPISCYPISVLGQCSCGIPDGIGWKAGYQCCDQPILPRIWPNYERDGEYRYSSAFSYTSSTGNDPIVHTYPFELWTLTF